MEQKSFNKRLIAEWETQEFVQLMFPHSQSDWGEYLDEVLPVFEEIAQSIAKYQPCIVCYMEEKGIQNIKNKENIILKKVASNDTWCRDFGGITILNGDKIEVLDYIFNGWGNKFDASLDNQITKELFCDIKSYDFVLEGGSIDSNGDGVVLTTSECLLEKNRNPSFTKEQITAKLKDDLGIKELIWIENGYLEGDDTDSHIDMLARFVDKNTIVYQTCDDKDDIHYKPLKLMEEEIKKLPFQSYALPWIEAKYYDDERLPASYANFLFINGAVLVPIYQDKNDEKALELFKKLLPKYDIIGIDCSKIIRQHGSLHCCTMQYPKGVRLNEKRK